MKKYFILLAAVLGMVACNKNEGVNNDEPSAPKKIVTLHATVNMGDDSANGPKRIAPDAADWSNPSATSVNFHWEVGDQVLVLGIDETGENLSGESSVFTVSSINATDPSKATLTGEALEDMSMYYVFYMGENPTYDKLADIISTGKITLTYQSGKTNIMFYGIGADDAFGLDGIYTTLRLQLKGDAQLGKIVVSSRTIAGGTPHENTTLNFGADGLQLTSTPIDVTIPLCDPETDYVDLTFYDKQERVVLKKTAGYQWFLTRAHELDKIINFGVLEVNKPVTFTLKEVYDHTEQEEVIKSANAGLIGTFTVPAGTTIKQYIESLGTIEGLVLQSNHYHLTVDYREFVLSPSATDVITNGNYSWTEVL